MLSDKDLLLLAKEQEIVSPFNPDNCKGATINLTLDYRIRKYTSTEPIVLGSKVDKHQYEDINISETEFWLKPNESVLVQTNEYFKVPVNMGAVILERYSLKLLGLMISPASYMNPGYQGRMSFLAINHSSVPMRLIPGIKFCQLALFELTSEALKPYQKQDAKYMGTSEVGISKLHLDKEIQEFLKQRGIERVSDQLASELGEHLMSQVRHSAKRLADILREEEGENRNE